MSSNREVRTPDVESLRQGFVNPEDVLACMVPRRSPVSAGKRFQVSVYLPYRVIEAFRPRVGEALDDILSRAPAWAGYRYMYVPWRKRFPYAGEPVKSTVKLNYPYPPSYVSSVIATTLEMLEVHGRGFRWTDHKNMEEKP